MAKQNKVTVSHDPSVIRHPNQELSNEQKYAKSRKAFPEDLESFSVYDRLGMKSSARKFGRQVDFKKSFDSGKFVTLSAAMRITGLGRQICRNYAKEMNLNLYDDEKNFWICPKGITPPQLRQ